uniref:F-box domain-containing protein n=1 Tax=Gibberella zeae TaxID=5518 RepID=A0A4E9EH82_GIBZA
MSTSTVNSSPQINKRWTPAEDIFFVGLLHEVLQSDTTRSKKSTALKSVLESCKAGLQEKFPGTMWTNQRIRSRYKLIECNYLAYQAALEMPGSIEVIGEGKIRLSKKQMLKLEVSYPKAAPRILKNGLRVSDNVTVDTYHQIFSRDTHSGGIYIVKGQQDVIRYDNPSLSIASGNAKSTVADCFTAQSLSTLPTEVLFMIGSYLSHHELRVVTLLSKQFRDIFFAQLFTKIQISGDLLRLSQRLRSFIDGLEKEWTRIVNCSPKYVTFVILETELERYPTASKNSLVALIGEFLRKMSELEGVIFDVQLQNQEQIQMFNNLFKETEKWTHPCSAIFESIDISNYKTILHQFSPGTLKAVQLPTRSWKIYYNELKRSCSSLKALHVYTIKRSSLLQLSRCMDDPMITWIIVDFPYIESLVLDQNIAYRSYRNRNDKWNINLFLAQLITLIPVADTHPSQDKMPTRRLGLHGWHQAAIFGCTLIMAIGSHSGDFLRWLQQEKIELQMLDRILANDLLRTTRETKFLEKARDSDLYDGRLFDLLWQA